MSHYTNQVQPDSPIAMGDTISFLLKDRAGNPVTINYVVADSYLEFRGEEAQSQVNAYIFDVLGLEKYGLASRAYGYTSEDGDWPESHDLDYEALTRLTLMLFAACDGVVIAMPRINDNKARVVMGTALRGQMIDMLQLINGQVRGDVFNPDRLGSGPAVGATLDLLEKVAILEKDGEVYKVKNRSALEFQSARFKGEGSEVTFSLDSLYVAKVLKALRTAPNSLSTSTLNRTFTDASNLGLALNVLKSKGLVKCWDRGWYCLAAQRAEADRLIATAGL